MNTVAKTAKSRKPVVRTIRLKLKPFEGNPGVVNIVVGKVVSDYFVISLNSDFGRAFKLEKFTGELAETYHVNLDLAEPEKKSTCECKGFIRWGHCKHISGMLKLVTEGKL